MPSLCYGALLASTPWTARPSSTLRSARSTKKTEMANAASNAAAETTQQTSAFLQNAAHMKGGAEVAEFFGTVNWLPGELKGNLVHTQIGDFSTKNKIMADAKVWLGIRPENLSFPDGVYSPQPNHISANLRNAVFLGDQYTFEASSSETVLHGKSRIAPKLQDEQLHIAVDPDDVMIFPADEKNTPFIKNSIENN